MIRAPLTLLLAGLVLTGCATMSADECRVADWYLIGEMDAREGRTPAYLAYRDRDCREAGFPADPQGWREGWEHGLTVFCTAPQGFRFGRAGNRYDPICPAALETDFLDGYDLGRQLHEVSESLNGLRGRLRTVEGSLSEGVRNDSLDEESLADLQRQQRTLTRQIREAELRLAELTGLARGRGLH